jgi:hypothetical protein
MSHPDLDLLFVSHEVNSDLLMFMAYGGCPRLPIAAIESMILGEHHANDFHVLRHSNQNVF